MEIKPNSTDLCHVVIGLMREFVITKIKSGVKCYEIKQEKIYSIPIIN